MRSTANVEGARRGLVVAMLLVLFMPPAAGAGESVQAPPPPAQDGAPEAKTLKERLSDKASDEQRVDNCRVPLERRGSKPRPDCAPLLSGPSAKSN